MLYVTFLDKFSNPHSIPIETTTSFDQLLIDVCKVSGIDSNHCHDQLTLNGEKFSVEELDENSVIEFSPAQLEDNIKPLREYFDEISCNGWGTLSITDEALPRMEKFGFRWEVFRHRKWLFGETSYTIEIAESAFEPIWDLLKHDEWLGNADTGAELTNILYDESYWW